MSCGKNYIKDTYTYNGEGRLAGYTGHDGAEVSYTYGPTGLLVKKETHSSGENRAVTYLYDEAREYAQVLTEGSDKGTASYTYEGSGLPHTRKGRA